MRSRQHLFFGKQRPGIYLFYIFAVIVPLSQQLRNIIVLLSSFHSISVNRINHPFQLSLPLDSKPVGSAPHRFSRSAPLKPLAAAAAALAIAPNAAVTHSLEMPRQHVEACREWRERHEHAAIQTAVSAQRGQSSHVCRLASHGFVVPENSRFQQLKSRMTSMSAGA